MQKIRKKTSCVDKLVHCVQDVYVLGDLLPFDWLLMPGGDFPVPDKENLKNQAALEAKGYHHKKLNLSKEVKENQILNLILISK